MPELHEIPKNGLNVFSCFSCGGGSTMGYKLAGYSVIGNCEIDKAMNQLYVKNQHPKYNYNMDIRNFKALKNLPVELFNLDILDGSPPCSTFSLAGQREDAWGKKKVFREGQTAQTLDDLFFEFLDVAARLQPKVIVAENVRGLLMGNAKGYLNQILHRLREIKYVPQVFLLNAAFMGVPQRRERVFIIAQRSDMQCLPLKLKFQEVPIPYGSIKAARARCLDVKSKLYWYWSQRLPHDTCIGDISKRIYGKPKGFTNAILHDNMVSPTLTANGSFMRYSTPEYLSNMDMIRIQTFPNDYDFMGQSVQYVCGMSVPPVMAARIAEQIYNQWLKN